MLDGTVQGTATTETGLRSLGSGAALGDLLASCAALREVAAHAIATSQSMVPTVQHALRGALEVRLASRAHLQYARLEGTLGGTSVFAVVRTTGEVIAGPALVSRAQLVVALDETFADGKIAASLNGPPVASTLTLMRAMDAVKNLEIMLSAAGGYTEVVARAASSSHLA